MTFFFYGTWSVLLTAYDTILILQNFFAGYILANLHTSVIASSKYFYQILTKIGKLSVPELLLAVSKSKLIDLVELASGVFVSNYLYM